jgi:AraC-like DNA-binding protein
MAGLDVDRLLQNVGVTAADLNDQKHRLAYPVAVNFRNQVFSTIKNDAFALLVGEKLPMGELGILDYICASSQTVSNAMSNLSRYFSLAAHPDFALSYLEQDQKGLISYGNQKRLSPQQYLFEQQSTEFTFSITLSRIRMLTKTLVKPRLVSFRHAAPSYVDEYQRIFQAPIEFEAVNNLLVFEPDVLALSAEYYDRSLHQILKRYADDSVSNLPENAGGVTHQVVEGIKQVLQGGEPTVASIAKRLFMSPRTLHRKLKEENTSFTRLRDQLRCDLAKSMLKNPKLSITDISFLLGFSQPSAFNRAFKRWKDTTPQQFRDHCFNGENSSTS